GWTVFNNKGKPVRQYEPFLSSLADRPHQFEFARKEGLSPTLFYDPVERVVAKLQPNHTYEKAVFDAWQEKTFDVNDTVLLDPQTDPDVRTFFTRLPDSDYLPTWHEARKNGQKGAGEKAAADKAAVHAGTPTTAYFDSAARIFLTITHNRFASANGMVEEHYPNRVEARCARRPTPTCAPIWISLAM
ncbi:MAG: hypothetical protein ACREQW_02475, partial [Candidatus Binatia bacterium]